MNLSELTSSAYIPDLEQFFTNVELRKSYQENLIRAIEIKKDDIIIAALNTSANCLAMPNANTLDIDGFASFLRVFDAAGLVEDRALVLSRGAATNIRKDSTLSSILYSDKDYLSTGTLPVLYGVKPVVSNRLPIPTAGKRRVFAFTKDAVDFWVSEDTTTEIEYVEERKSWLIKVKVIAGASIINQDGVHFADIND